MSHIIDRLTFFTRKASIKNSDGHGITTNENRDWERAYRNRWAHDKVVRSTHGVNCTGSCSWKIYVKTGWSLGRHNILIIRARGLICPIMNRADARVEQATVGTCTVPHG